MSSRRRFSGRPGKAHRKIRGRRRFLLNRRDRRRRPGSFSPRRRNDRNGPGHPGRLGSGRRPFPQRPIRLLFPLHRNGNHRRRKRLGRYFFDLLIRFDPQPQFAPDRHHPFISDLKGDLAAAISISPIELQLNIIHRLNNQASICHRCPSL
jgi:hypothetical protein